MFAVFESNLHGKYYMTVPAERRTVGFADVWKIKLLLICVFELWSFALCDLLEFSCKLNTNSHTLRWRKVTFSLSVLLLQINILL